MPRGGTPQHQVQRTERGKKTWSEMLRFSVRPFFELRILFMRACGGDEARARAGA